MSRVVSIRVGRAPDAAHRRRLATGGRHIKMGRAKRNFKNLNPLLEKNARTVRAEFWNSDLKFRGIRWSGAFEGRVRHYDNAKRYREYLQANRPQNLPTAPIRRLYDPQG